LEVALSLSIGKGSSGLKKEKRTDFGVLSHSLEMREIYTNPFLEDLDRVIQLSRWLERF
jgi:hypothetical protein